jgi:hypothetical protein
MGNQMGGVEVNSTDRTLLSFLMLTVACGV